MRATSFLALAFAASCLWLANGQDPAPAPSAPVAPFARHALADELDCATCHATIVDEWATSAHAHAWIDELYRAELATKQRPESCHGCHIPTPLAEVALHQKPPPRGAELEAHEFGVSCLTCHAGPEGALLGPYGAQTKAHPTLRDPRFAPERSNELCIGCHATTIGPVIGIARDFLGTDPPPTGERRQGCVECHMSAVVRSMATDANDEPLAPRAGRSHALLGPSDARFLATAFELGWSADEDGARTLVRLTNRAGHRIPGLLDRRFEFAFDALDEQGAVLGSARLSIDQRGFLAADATREIELPARAAGVRVRATHHARRLPEPVVFDERVLPAPAR
jgi:Cytochrome c554 and c-prime